MNEAVVHGVPNERLLQEGDLLKLDVGVELDSFFGDSAWTFPVGKVGDDVEALCRVCRSALEAGVRAARPGERIRAIAAAIEEAVRGTGFAIVTDYVGHGIGRQLHEPPQVPNVVSDDMDDLGIELVPGMVLAIEPMVTVGSGEVETLDDGWTVVTKDGGLASHFEHTVWISDGGPDIVTCLDEVGT